MELVFRICLFVAGIINIVPSVLAFIPSKITKSYGIEIPDSNYELLLRHRAVLFGIIGGIMIYAAITKKNYSLAVLIGSVSMISFLVLYMLANGEINPELYRIMRIDVIGLIILWIGYSLFKWRDN